MRLAYQLEDVEKLGDLVGTTRLPWETLPVFRGGCWRESRRCCAARSDPGEIRTFVYDYLRGAEESLGCTFVPLLNTVDAEHAYSVPAGHPHFRPLELREFPLAERNSATFGPSGGYVSYLYRWEEINRGLFETPVSVDLIGLSAARTTVPVLVNLTTGDMIGYTERLAVGQLLDIGLRGESETREAAASIDGRDVTGRLISMSGFRLGVPFDRADLDPQPRLPRLACGPNQWLFLSVGLFDIRGLNHTFFAIVDQQLRNGVFDDTSYDHALFETGMAARVRMNWTEQVPASFEVRVPR